MRRVAWLALGAALAVWIALAQDGDPRSPGTREMADLLARIYREQDFKTDPSKAAERARYYRDILTRDLDLRTEPRARLDLGQNLLTAGDNAEAVDELEKLRKFASERGIVLNPNFDRQLRESLAMAYLRLGEQQNCLNNHNAQSCVYPIRGGGVHKERRGAEGAIREWTALLEKDPNNLAARWLLNIAYMTLGRHPAGVPRKWLVPDTILPSEYDIGAFTDVAPQAGVSVRRLAGGSIAEDFDGDGLFDLVVSSSGPNDGLRYFHNKGDGTFEYQSAAAGLAGLAGGLNLIHADYNNDGHSDILVLRGGWWARHGKYPPSLLRNNGPDARGQTTFSDVTE